MVSKHWTECDTCGKSSVKAGPDTDDWFGAFASGSSLSEDLDFCSWDCMRTFMVEHPTRPAVVEDATYIWPQSDPTKAHLLSHHIHPTT